MKSVVFLDLDGVLVDFSAGIKSVHGEPKFPDQLYDYDVEKRYGMSANEFWRPFDHDFWANLPWTAEGHELLIGVEELFSERLVLMTSPCLTPGCVEGKVSWIKKHVPHLARRFFVGPPKYLAAAPCKVLIDDHNLNVDKFIEHRGRALLVPRPWNRRRDETDANGHFSVTQVLDELKQMLK